MEEKVRKIKLTTKRMLSEEKNKLTKDGISQMLKEFC